MSNNQVAVIQKDITDSVSNSLSRLQEEGLKLPANYNASNALKSAFFKLQETKDRNNQPALSVCTKESIANSLLDMTVQGLSPAKTQCYFIVYGDQLQLNRSYFGTQAVLKRLTNVKDIWANVIFEGDEFDYEIDRGREKLVKHVTKFENRDNKILGAYAVVQTEDDEELLTVMTKKEIDASWGQSKTKGAVHGKFPQEMAKRTVINRAAKAFINTSDDSDLLVEAINNSTENEYDERERKDVSPQQEIDEKANRIPFEVVDTPKKEEQKEPVKEPEEQPTETAEDSVEKSVEQTILEMDELEDNKVPF